MKINSSAYMIMYVVVMGVAVSLLLTGVGQLVAPRRQANEEAERIRNVLVALGVPFNANDSTAVLSDLYRRQVRVVQEGAETRYLYQPEGSAEPIAMALHVEGPGLWGPIKGFLALEKDRNTVRGITFYQQEETPGLGGEIATDGFCSRFRGKQIRVDGQSPRLRIRAPGSATAANEVDGITGATMTCGKVETLLNKALAGLDSSENKP